MLALIAFGAVFIHTALAETGVGGEWQGEYTCAQGVTGITLTLTPSAPVGQATTEPVNGLFSFYATKANPKVPHGCFEVAGSFEPATHEVELDGGGWIVQPRGFVTVDLAGAVSSDGGTMTGSVRGPYCTRFKLYRVAPGTSSAGQVCQRSGVIASSSP